MADTAGARLDRLVGIMRALRAPDGCPWDREQTLASLRPFVLEEASRRMTSKGRTYEVLEAIESGSPANLREELGDYLYEMVFLAQISEEAGDFSIADAIDTVCEKLRRARHARRRDLRRRGDRRQPVSSGHSRRHVHQDPRHLPRDGSDLGHDEPR